MRHSTRCWKVLWSHCRPTITRTPSARISIQFNIWVHSSYRFNFMHFLFNISFYILIFFTSGIDFNVHAPFIGMQNYSTYKKFCIWIAAVALMKCSWFSVQFQLYIHCFDGVLFLVGLRHYKLQSMAMYQCVVPFCLPQWFNPTPHIMYCATFW